MPAGDPLRQYSLEDIMRPTLRSVSGLLCATAALAGSLVAATGPAAGAASCTDVHFVDARGTWEPGALGFIVGDPVFSALKSKVPGKSWSAYAVNYPADLSGGSASKGNTDLVEHLKKQV